MTLQLALFTVISGIRRLLGKGVLNEEHAYLGLARFTIVGLLSTYLYLALVLILDVVGITPRWGATIAIVMCWVFSYVMQATVTFRTPIAKRRFLMRFVVMSLIGLAVAQASTIVVHEFLGFSLWVAAFTVCIVIPVINFLLMNFWVFLPR